MGLFQWRLQPQPGGQLCFYGERVWYEVYFSWNSSSLMRKSYGQWLISVSWAKGRLRPKAETAASVCVQPHLWGHVRSQQRQSDFSGLHARALISDSQLISVVIYSALSAIFCPGRFIRDAVRDKEEGNSWFVRVTRLCRGAQWIFVASSLYSEGPYVPRASGYPICNDTQLGTMESLIQDFGIQWPLVQQC